MVFLEQIQRGAVRNNTDSPSFNETFGFFVEMAMGAPKTDHLQIGLYHHDFITKQDKSLGTICVISLPFQYPMTVHAK